MVRGNQMAKISAIAPPGAVHQRREQVRRALVGIATWGRWRIHGVSARAMFLCM